MRYCKDLVRIWHQAKMPGLRRGWRHRYPGDLGEGDEQNDAELLALAVEEAAARAPRVRWHREEAGRDATPEAAATVHLVEVEVGVRGEGQGSR